MVMHHNSETDSNDANSQVGDEQSPSKRKTVLARATTMMEVEVASPFFFFFSGFSFLRA